VSGGRLHATAVEFMTPMQTVNYNRYEHWKNGALKLSNTNW